MRVWVKFIIAVVVLSGGVAEAQTRFPNCTVDGQVISAAQCTEWADAAWEGLGMEEQQHVYDTGLTGLAQDQYVIDYRSGYRIDEDEASWDCNTMGNRRCGPSVVHELPRTS